MTGPPPTPPPKWKTAVVTLVAVFPPVLLFNVTIVPFLGGLSVVLRTLTLCVGVTAAVTWVMMPRLMPLVKNWLNPPRGEPAGPATEAAMPSRGSSRSRAGRDGDGAARPAWLLDVAPVERTPERETWYLPRVPAQRVQRRAPWYGPQPEDDYQTVEYERYERYDNREEDDYYFYEERDPGRYRR